MTLNEAAFKTDLQSGQTLDLSTMADITGGTAEVVNGGTTKSSILDTKNGVLHVTPRGDVYVHVHLDNPLADGDVISFESNNAGCSAFITTSNERGETYYTTDVSNGKATFSVTDEFLGNQNNVTDFYIWSKNRLYIRSITVTQRSYTYTLQARIDGTLHTISQGMVGKDDVTVYYPKGFFYNGKYYLTATPSPSDSPRFAHTFPGATSEDHADKSDYRDYTDNNVVAYLEGEDIKDAFSGDFSNGKYGRVPGNAPVVIAGNLPVGSYTFYAYCHNSENNADLGYYLRDSGNPDNSSNVIGNSDLASTAASDEYYFSFNNYTQKTVTLSGSTQDGRTNQSADFDYAFIIYNGEITPVTGISLNKTEAEVTVGGASGTETLTATLAPTNPTPTVTDVEWSTSDPNIATVANGVVTGVATGTVTITAKAKGGDYIIATCTVYVRGESQPESSLNIIDSDYTFTPSETLIGGQLYENNKILSKGAGNKYESEDEDIQIKYSRQIAFKVNNGAKVIVKFRTSSGRTMKLGDDFKNSSKLEGYSLASSDDGTLTYYNNSGGEKTLYLAASGDLYLTELKVLYKTYEVTYNVTHGSCSKASETESEPAVGVELPTVTPENGYTFVGWSTQSAAVNADAGAADGKYYPSGNTNLYAVCIQQLTLQSVVINGHTLVADNNGVYSYKVGRQHSSDMMDVVITPNPNAKAAVGEVQSAINGASITAQVNVTDNLEDNVYVTVSTDGSSSTAQYTVKVEVAQDIDLKGADCYALENTTYYEGQRFLGGHIDAYISPTVGGGNDVNAAGSTYGNMPVTDNNNTTGDIPYSYRFIHWRCDIPVYNSNTGVPSSGCFYAFKPTVDGVLEVGVNISQGVKLIVSDGTNILTKGTDFTHTFGLDRENKVTESVTGGSIRIYVAPNKTYYVYAAGATMGIFGFALNQYLYVKENTKTFTLSEANLSKYAFFTKTNAANSIEHSGSTIYRIKDTTDKVTVKVKRAKSVAAVVYNGGGGNRGYTISEGSTVMGTEIQSGGEVTSTYYGISESGASITLAGKGSDLYAYQLKFAKTIPTVINVTKDSKKVSEITLYQTDEATDYIVSTNNNGSDIELDASAVSNFATVAYEKNTKILTITPKGGGLSGTGNIVLSQYRSGDYTSGSYILKLTVKKMALTLSITHAGNDHYTKTTNNGSVTNQGSYYSGTIAAPNGGSTTGWTVTAKDEENKEVSGLSYQYYSDDPSIATVNISDGATSLVGNASGTAYVTVVFEGDNTYEAAKAQYSLTIGDGYDVKLTNGEKPDLNQRYEAKDGSNNVLCTMIACGYKYNEGKFLGNVNDKDSWDAPSAYSDRSKLPCQIDGFIQQSQAEKDSQDERANEIEWVSDDKNRVKVFSLPVRGAYLKFEPEVNGVLTAYVLQNGDIEMDRTSGGDGLPVAVGKAPRAYYWFDQDGYRLEPESVTSKLPLCYGRDYTKNGRQVFFDNDDKKESHNLNYWYGHNDGLQELYENATNPMWPTQAQVDANLKRILPDPQPLVRYNNGYSIHQKAYVKYVLNVVAGNTYYFFSNVSKLGMAGFNFKPTADNESITYKTTSGTTITASTETIAKSLNQTADVATTFKAADKTVKVYKTVTFDRTFKVDTWNTITLPFPLTEKQVEDVFGVGTILVTFNGVARSAGQNTAFFLRHVDQNILAGQPYFIKPTGVKSKTTDNNGNVVAITYINNVTTGDATPKYVGGNGGLKFHNVNCDYKLALQNYERESYKESGSCAYKDPDLKCVGTLAQTPVNKYDYYINATNGNLYEYTGGGTQMNAYRAFLKQNGTNQVKLTSVNYSGLDGVDWEDEATGIMEVLVNDLDVEIAPVKGVYNLNGQKVGDSTKGLPAGLYIVNGKVINIK